MDLADILLWTFSLVLAFIGIIFGLISSINSTRALREIQNLIKKSRVTEESERLFYTNLTQSRIDSVDIVRQLRDAHMEITNWDFAMIASTTRLNPTPNDIATSLVHTQYEDILKSYRKYKTKADIKFLNITKNFNLKKDTPMSKELKLKLIDYYRWYIQVLTNLIVQYTNINKDIR
ncbi:MAG: hypothetical protein K4H23_05075 [Mollicutes bacterium PWAP]|nr:hypothetical protein [Mollicutes bacterium PWAP]